MLATLLSCAVLADNRLEIESGPGRAGALSWEALSLQVSLDESGGTLGWHAQGTGLELAGQHGRLSVDCEHGGLRSGRPWCERGAFEWQPAGGGSAIVGQLFDPAEAAGVGLALADDQVRAVLHWPDGERELQAAVRLRDFDLAILPDPVAAAVGLSVLEGRVDGSLRLDGMLLHLDLALSSIGFDRPDGLFAGADLSLGLRGEVGLDPDNGWSFSVALSQEAGELLAGPVYLPPPDAPLSLSAAGHFLPGSGLRVESLRLVDGDQFQAGGTLGLVQDEGGWSLASLDIDDFELRLPGAWSRWGEGLAATAGFGGLQTSGRLGGAFSWRDGELGSLRIDADSIAVEDANGRFALAGLDGRVERDRERMSVALDLAAIELFSLDFGQTRMRASGRNDDWQLSEALVLPLLDGAVVLDRLRVRADAGGAPRVELDARIEPLELADLTDMLGFPTFGGTLSGRFPGVQFEGDRIAFTGGIDVQAFSGRIGLGELVIERPFGSLPALAAQVEIERLDLAELTGAFNFGHMEGKLSGWMRDLRLLDWRPVAMDARLYTHEDAPSRRISQRAVENLSRLGGGAAALSAPLLRMFEDFPYRRAGLACRLDRNICHIDGVAPHESGGFYIVEGRSLPRLDVIGHRRLIDWPRLVAQLAAIAGGR